MARAYEPGVIDSLLREGNHLPYNVQCYFGRVMTQRLMNVW